MLARIFQPSVTTAILVAAPLSLLVSGMLPPDGAPSPSSGVVALAFLDLNADGRHDAANEPLLKDWQMCLESPVRVCATRATAGASTWWLEGSEATVAARPPGGFTLTTPATQQVALEAGRVTTVRFGARPLAGEGDAASEGADDASMRS